MPTIRELTKQTDKNTDIVIVLDESGSMEELKETVVKCFNDFLKEQKEDGDDAFITLVKFNGDVNFIFRRKAISSAENIDNEDYTPKGTTALYDAILSAVDDVERKNKNNSVIVAIITDGYENSSKERDVNKVKEKIKEKEKLGWRFLFLASNIDANAVASSFGICSANTVSFMSNECGYKNMNSNLAADVISYRTITRMN